MSAGEETWAAAAPPGQHRNCRLHATESRLRVDGSDVTVARDLHSYSESRSGAHPSHRRRRRPNEWHKPRRRGRESASRSQQLLPTEDALFALFLSELFGEILQVPPNIGVAAKPHSTKRLGRAHKLGKGCEESASNGNRLRCRNTAMPRMTLIRALSQADVQQQPSEYNM